MDRDPLFLLSDEWLKARRAISPCALFSTPEVPREMQPMYNTFSIASIICILIISTGCAGRHTTQVVPPARMDTARETVRAGLKPAPTAIDECSQLATFSSDEVPGWKLASPIGTYDKRTLFDYIDGAAELYFAYDFRAVAAAEYQNGETSIIIDVYDMTSSEGAFGIYSINRYPEANYVDIGNEGILTGTALDFWKGRYFCRIYSFDVAEKYQNDVINFGSRLASKIQEAGEEPSVLGSLPQDGLIPKTARFFSRKLGLDNIRYVSEGNILNLSPDTKGAVAEYKMDDSRFQVFVIVYPSPDEALLAFETYSKYLEKEAQLLTTDTTNLGTCKMFKMDGRFTFMDLKGQRLLGFWDVESQEIAQAFEKSLSRRF